MMEAFSEVVPSSQLTKIKTMTMIISLTGLSGCGKDTAAIMLSKNGFVRFAWASAIRRIVAKGFPDAPPQYLSQSGFIEADKQWEKNSGFHDRLLNLSDAVTQQAFLDSLAEIENLSRLGFNIVVSDTRFPREYKFLREYCAIMVEIIREHRCRTPQKHDRHLESMVFDYKVANNGSLNDLAEQLKQIISTNNHAIYSKAN
jgi:hypothetical protein